MKTITVTIDPSGRVTVTTSGYSGRECLDASGPMEQALGATVETERTSEFYRTPAAGRDVDA